MFSISCRVKSKVRMADPEEQYHCFYSVDPPSTSFLHSCRGPLEEESDPPFTHTNNTDKMKLVLSTDLEYGTYKIIGGLPRWCNGPEST